MTAAPEDGLSSLARSNHPKTQRNPVWHRLRAVVDASQTGIDFWLSKPDDTELPAEPTATLRAYRTNLLVGAIDVVSGTRIAPDAWFLIDDLVVTGGEDLPRPHAVPELPAAYPLWSGESIASDVTQIPLAPDVQHQTIHRADADGYRFLHGAAIVHHQGVLYANWANSPTNENGPEETLQGRRSTDGGKSWSDIEVIGPGFSTEERHSHGVLFVHQDEVWTICSRFGIGPPARRFPGLAAEAFVLDRGSDRWLSRGIVMQNCWPYDEPVKMSNGNYITGGQDKDGLPVVAISQGENLLKWQTVLIPFPPDLSTQLCRNDRRRTRRNRSCRDPRWRRCRLGREERQPRSKLVHCGPKQPSHAASESLSGKTRKRAALHVVKSR